VAEIGELGDLAQWMVAQARVELNDLKEVIAASTTLNEIQKLDAAVDIESIRDQLAKSEPNKGVVRSLWEGVRAIATAGGAIQAVERAFPLSSRSSSAVAEVDSVGGRPDGRTGGRHTRLAPHRCRHRARCTAPGGGRDDSLSRLQPRGPGTITRRVFALARERPGWRQLWGSRGPSVRIRRLIMRCGTS
jgi:hypothetical protein